MNNLGSSTHLDLGCGGMPRNPYFCDIVYGVDLKKRVGVEYKNVFIVEENLILNPIPFANNTFDSVSAYDFLEHIPRLLCVDGVIKLPFIELMNEIFRVTKNGGKFYAVTPFYPMDSSFVDPTHVNFISRDTYKYFTAPHNWASMYGFIGKFNCISNRIVNFDIEVNRPPHTLKGLLKRGFSFIYKKSRQHIVWEFEVIKP